MSDIVIGYVRKLYGSYDPIYPAQPGYIYTRAFILCHKCNTTIRSHGGPYRTALCIPCYEKEVNE